MVIKMRGCAHSKAIVEYEISPNGMVIIGGTVKGYRGLISGLTERVELPEQRED